MLFNSLMFFESTVLYNFHHCDMKALLWLKFALFNNSGYLDLLLLDYGFDDILILVLCVIHFLLELVLNLSVDLLLLDYGFDGILILVLCVIHFLLELVLNLFVCARLWVWWHSYFSTMCDSLFARTGAQFVCCSEKKSSFL
jgi:hypothetical protein